MSDIKMIDSKTLSGRVESFSIPNSKTGEAGKFDAIVTIQHDKIWTDCILCKHNSYTEHRLLDEGLCELCRDKIITRFQLILDLE